MTDHAAQAGSGLQIAMLGEEFGHLGLDRWHQLARAPLRSTPVSGS